MSRAIFRLSAACMSVPVLLVACAHTPPIATAPPPEPSSPNLAPAGEVEPQAAPVEGSTLAQAPGDFIVYRFSGAYRKAPLTLSERVVDAEGTQTVVDMTFDDGMRKKTTIRAHFDHTRGAERELVSVARVESGTERSMPLDAFDKMMEGTILAADRNEETLGSEKVKLSVAGKELACDKRSYRVAIGRRTAVMSTLTSDGFAWGDVGGEIRSEDGKLLYRAEVIDFGNAR